MTRHQTTTVRRYEPMSRLKSFTVAKGMTDARGWEVADAEGRAIGKVKDLVVDTDRMVATHLSVDLDLHAFELDDDPRVLVPMARARRDGDRRRLIVPELTRTRVAQLFAERSAREVQFWDEWWQREGGALEPATREDLVADRRMFTEREVLDPPRTTTPVTPAGDRPPADGVWSEERGVREERTVARERTPDAFPADERRR